MGGIGDMVAPTRGRTAGFRVCACAAIGVVVAVLLILAGAVSFAPAVGWDAAAAAFVAWTWVVIWPMPATATADHATREDPTRAVSDVVILAAAVASLSAVGFFLVKAGNAKGTTQDVLALVGVATVVLAWLILHTVFTLRYALLYYTGKDGGVDFNQEAAPRYSDFAYLAFTLGMTFQVSDTDLRSPRIRATALRHALLSYLFGAILLATTINMISSLATGSG
jgi:uncharacterized membrane protein